nr:MAG TPA: hypothetical protein [Caudoviricetes sp.]
MFKIVFIVVFFFIVIALILHCEVKANNLITQIKIKLISCV